LTPAQGPFGDELADEPAGAVPVRVLAGPGGRVDVIVTAHVQPGARRAEIGGVHGGALRLRVAAPPEGGRATQACLRLLAAALDVPLRAVALEAGATSRRKRLRVQGVDPAAAARFVQLVRQRARPGGGEATDRR